MCFLGMIESNHKAVIKIFAMPVEACDYRKTWKAAFEYLSQRLHKRYGNRIEMEFIELFSPESFQYADIMKMVEEGKQSPPYVTVDDRLVSYGGKLSEGAIRLALDSVTGRPNILIALE